MSCQPDHVAAGSRNLRLRFLFTELDAAGVRVPLDLGTPGTTAWAYFRRPDRTLLSAALEVDSPTSDGSASYYTPPGFLDYVGTWQAWGAVIVPGSGPGTGTFVSSVQRFVVDAFARELAGLASSIVLPTPTDAAPDAPAPIVSVA